MLEGAIDLDGTQVCCDVKTACADVCVGEKESFFENVLTTRLSPGPT